MNIGISGVLHALQNPDEWLIIDVRAPYEYDGTGGACPAGFSGRIAGSINIEWSRANVGGTQNMQIRPEEEIRDIFAAAFEGRNVILYCRGGPRGNHTWMVLSNLGVNAYAFCGSWIEWGYALDPTTNHPYRELVLQFTEALSHANPN
jgi:3-mercaptopyruvate sulfurtransferase SseA